MLKFAGMALIVLCCSMTGIFKASSLSRRVLTLESTIRLYQYMHDRLKYLRPSTGALISQAEASGEFGGLSFLSECCENMRTGKCFYESWSEAASRSEQLIGKQAAAIIANLANVLGRSDVESQLAALEYGKAMLEDRLFDAREYAGKHKKLYRTLGLLAGLGIAVFIA